MFESKKEDIFSIENIIKNINNNDSNNDNDYQNYFEYYELSKMKNIRAPIINYFYIKKNESDIKDEEKFKIEESSFQKVEKMINDNKLIKMNKTTKQILYDFINKDDKNKEILIKIFTQKNYNFLINDLNNNLNNEEKLNNMKNDI